MKKIIAVAAVLSVFFLFSSCAPKVQEQEREKEEVTFRASSFVLSERSESIISSEYGFTIHVHKSEYGVSSFGEKYSDNPNIWIERMLKLSDGGKKNVTLSFEEDGVKYQLIASFYDRCGEIYYDVIEESEIPSSSEVGVYEYHYQTREERPVILGAKYSEALAL